MSNDTKESEATVRKIDAETRVEIPAEAMKDIADAQTLGVHKTPGFFVNGKTMSSFGYDQLRELVVSEVKAQYGL